MIAPRPLECQNGRKEGPLSFTPKIASQVMVEIQAVYKALGKPKNAALDIHEGAHEIDLPSILKFFDEHLKADERTR